MKIFIDTSAWDAIEDSGDPNHEIALAFKDDLSNNCHLITSDYVLDETYTLLLLNIGYERTIAFQKNTSELLQTGILAIVHATPFLCDEAWDILFDGVASEPVFDAGVIVVESPEGFGFCFLVGTAAKNLSNALGQSEALEFIQKPFKETGAETR